MVLIGLALSSFAVYCVLCMTGRTPTVTGLDRRKFSEVIGPFITRYALWVLAPIEKTFVRLNVSPNVITFTSLFICASAGAAFAGGWLATGAWLYIGAGLLDILDGRLARATQRSSKAGAFLDSVADRWGELFVFAGFGWLLRSSPWLPVVFFAVGASLMVSYSRARGESLGVSIDGGTMQRAERIALVSIGALLTAFFEAARGGDLAGHVIGATLLMVALGSTVTALHRWVRGYKMLKAMEAGPADVTAADPADSATNMKVAMKSKHRPAA